MFTFNSVIEFVVVVAVIVVVIEIGFIYTMVVQFQTIDTMDVESILSEKGGEREKERRKETTNTNK